MDLKEKEQQRSVWMKTTRIGDAFLILLVAVVTGTFWGFVLDSARDIIYSLEETQIGLHWLSNFGDTGYVHALRSGILDGLWSLLWVLFIYICVLVLTVILIRAVAKRLGIGVVVGTVVLSILLVLLAFLSLLGIQE